MKKIIFITREGYDLAGARIRCYNFAKELRKYRIETEVFSFADTLGAGCGKKEAGLTIKDKIRYNLEAINKLKKEKDVIFIINRLNYHSFAPWILSILNSNKLVFDMDDWEIREDPKYYLGILPTSKAEFLTRKIAKYAIFCIGASRYLVNYLSQFNKNTYYIPSGVDTERFTPLEKTHSFKAGLKKENKLLKDSLELSQNFLTGFKPERINNKTNPKIILSWIGTMHRKSDIENVRFIIDCFLELKEKHSNIFLEIAGDGLYRNLLEEDKFKTKDIIFKGWIHPDDVPSYLNKIDIGLVPLIQNTKFNKAKSPVKLFEYMAMGKPTVSSNIGEIDEIIKDGEDGLLAKDKNEFISKMDLLITDQRLRKELGEKARESIRNNYSLKILSRKLLEILS